MENISENINEDLEYKDSLKQIIKETIAGICDKGIIAYPNICRYGSRSKLDQENIINKVLRYMTSDTLPMSLEAAINMVDCEFEPGFGE